MRRIQFFSIHDGASDHNLNEIDVRFSSLDLDQDFDVNDLLELYNAKLYLDNGMYLRVWDEVKRKKFKEKSDSCWTLLKVFFLNKINSDTILSIFGKVLFQYRSNFWEIISQLQVYKKITDDALKNILNVYPNEIGNILKQERLTGRFSTTVHDFLLTHPKTAELILMDEDISERKAKYFFPKSLSSSDKEKIICDYLDLERPNLNFVSLAEYAKETNTLRLSDKTRLKAKRVYNKLSEDLWKSKPASTQVYAVEIGTDGEQEKPLVYKYKEGTFTATYSFSFLKSLLETEDLIALFRDLFHFIDRRGFITLVSKNSEMDTMEKIVMRSKNEYPTGMMFSRKNMLSLGQISLTNHLLVKEFKSVSNLVIKYLENISGYDETLKILRFNMPSDTLSTAEKIRIVGPELESLLRQYQLYVTDGEIDFELLGISSKQISFSQMTSKVQNKYVYPILNTRLGDILYFFFSDQSMLHYVEPYEDKYDNLYSLLVNEDDIPMQNFEEYQKSTIDILIQEDYLFLDTVGCLKIKRGLRLFLISKLYENEVISYWHFPPVFRNEMDLMIQEGLCHVENTLFTKQEAAYFNYYMNKKEFTSGPDLRNKYLHGTNPYSERENNQDYLMFLRIVILCLLKIDDDLMVYKKSTN